MVVLYLNNSLAAVILTQLRESYKNLCRYFGQQ